MQCTNNLKQLALAAANYTNAVGCLPSGTFIQRIFDPPQLGRPEFPSFSPFVRFLPYLEQPALFDAANFLVNGFEPSNTTVHGTGLAGLWCPSDPVVSRIVPFPDYWIEWYQIGPTKFAKTSYACSAGPWDFNSNDSLDATIVGQNLGVLYQQSAVAPAAIRDGMSQTLIFAEHGHGL